MSRVSQVCYKTLLMLHREASGMSLIMAADCNSWNRLQSSRLRLNRGDPPADSEVLAFCIGKSQSHDQSSRAWINILDEQPGFYIIIPLMARFECSMTRWSLASIHSAEFGSHKPAGGEKKSDKNVDLISHRVALLTSEK